MSKIQEQIASPKQNPTRRATMTSIRLMVGVVVSLLTAIPMTVCAETFSSMKPQIELPELTRKQIINKNKKLQLFLRENLKYLDEYEVWDSSYPDGINYDPILMDRVENLPEKLNLLSQYKNVKNKDFSNDVATKENMTCKDLLTYVVYQKELSIGMVYFFDSGISASDKVVEYIKNYYNSNSKLQNNLDFQRFESLYLQKATGLNLLTDDNTPMAHDENYQVWIMAIKGTNLYRLIQFRHDSNSENSDFSLSIREPNFTNIYINGSGLYTLGNIQLIESRLVPKLIRDKNEIITKVEFRQPEYFEFTGDSKVEHDELSIFDYYGSLVSWEMSQLYTGIPGGRDIFTFNFSLYNRFRSDMGYNDRQCYGCNS